MLKGFLVVLIHSDEPAIGLEGRLEDMRKRAKGERYWLWGRRCVVDRWCAGFVVVYIGALDDDANDWREGHCGYVEDVIEARLGEGSVSPLWKLKRLGASSNIADRSAYS